MNDMMNSLSILQDNAGFLSQVYNFHALAWLLPLILVDVPLKGWAMWRAARLEKSIWFIALLLVNSLGVFPVIYLVLSRVEYAKFVATKKEDRSPL